MKLKQKIVIIVVHFSRNDKQVTESNGHCQRIGTGGASGGVLPRARH